MSRGLGRVQRVILTAVEGEGYAVLHELPGGYSQPALSRAARSLEDRGLVRVEIMSVPIKRKRKTLWLRSRYGEVMNSHVWRAVVTAPDASRQTVREMMGLA